MNPPPGIFALALSSNHCTLCKSKRGFPRRLSSKETACQCRRHSFYPWVRKTPWRRKWQPTPVFLPGEFHGQRSPGGYSPWGRKESDRTERTDMVLSHSVLSYSETPWIVACQAPLSMEISSQEHSSGLLFSSPGDHPDPGVKPVSPACPASVGRFLPLSQLGRLRVSLTHGFGRNDIFFVGSHVYTGLAKKFRFFCEMLQEISNKHFGQPKMLAFLEPKTTVLEGTLSAWEDLTSERTYP